MDSEPSGPAPRTSDRAADKLHGIVQSNEEIKVVIRTAFGIGITALNALLLARRAGRSALGFGVLSDELRQFARQLAQQMAQLRAVTESSVATVTGLVKEARYLAVLDRIQPDQDAIRDLVRTVREAQEQTVQKGQDALHALRLTLARLSDDLQPMVQLGTVLARSTRIEAAYGGGFAQALTQVAMDFSATIVQIEQSLGRLRKAAEESVE